MFKEPLKRSLQFTLLFCFLFFLGGCVAENPGQSQITSSAVEDETTGQSGDISLRDFALPGLHYYEDMGVIENKDQQDYMLDLSFVDIVNGTISAKGVISHNGEEAYELSASGKLFRSSVGMDERKSDVVAAIINSDNELVMFSCLIFKSHNVELLFPANSDYAGKPLMIFVLMAPDETVLFFSAPLPEDFQFDPLYESISLPDSSNKILIDIPEGYEVPEDSDEWPLNEVDAVNRATNYYAFAWMTLS